MGWILTLGLQNLRAQINAAFPDRDHTSDGTIGDAAHQAEVSGHNPDDTAGSKAAWNGDPDTIPEVRALDIDSDLRAAPATAQQLVDHIRKLPAVETVLRYMIYDRTMYHERDGFAPTPYAGASAHTEHIHFEGAWTQAADNNTSFDYRLEEIPVALTAADLAKIQGMITAAVATLKASDAATADDVLNAKIGDLAVPGRAVGDNERDFAKLRGTLVLAPDKELQNKVMEPGSPLDRMVRAADAILAKP